MTVLGLPMGVKASALTLKGTASEGKLTLAATKTAPPGPYQLILQGAAKGLTVAAAAVPLTLAAPK